MTLQFQPFCNGQEWYPPHQVTDFFKGIARAPGHQFSKDCSLCCCTVFQSLSASPVPLVHKELLASGISKEKKDLEQFQSLS